MTTTKDIVPLVYLAAEINAAHQQAEASAWTAVEHAAKAGELLTEAKAQIDHGSWAVWVEANCEFSLRTAQAYMRISHKLPDLDESKAQRVALLPLREAMKVLVDGPVDHAVDEKPGGADPDHATVITNELAGFVRLGFALREVRDRESWRDAGHKSFDEYCEVEHGLGRGQASVAIGTTRVMEYFRLDETESLHLLKNERLVRPFICLSPKEVFFPRLPLPDHAVSGTLGNDELIVQCSSKYNFAYYIASVRRDEGEPMCVCGTLRPVHRDTACAVMKSFNTKRVNWTDGPYPALSFNLWLSLADQSGIETMVFPMSERQRELALAELAA